MNLNWTIIGCGWLGKELGAYLVGQNATVFGSTRTLDHFNSIKEKGITPFILDDKSQISTEIIDKTDIVVLSVPPFDRSQPELYGNYLLGVCSVFKPETQFIFTSSTSIYPKKEGEYDEDYSFSSTEKENCLFQAESILSHSLKNNLTILRLGGLIGDDRHPIHSLGGKTEVKNPSGIINYIHRKDIISAMIEIVQQKAFGEVFNLVHPSYPIREKYLKEKAIELNLSPPQFASGNSTKRVIQSTKIQEMLGFVFKNDI